MLTFAYKIGGTAYLVKICSAPESISTAYTCVFHRISIFLLFCAFQLSTALHLFPFYLIETFMGLRHQDLKERHVQAVSRDFCVVLHCGALGLSAVCDCGIS